MNERSFFGSNLLVYTDDQDKPEKQRIALHLMRSISTASISSTSGKV